MIEVDVLFLVDAANGGKSDEIDRSVPENVKQVESIYNSDPNNNPLGSHGHAAKAKDAKTKVRNSIRITWVEEGKKKKVTHSNIDEATFDDVLKQINQFLNRK